LGLAFPFHIKRIKEAKNLEVIHSALRETIGTDHEIIVERIQRTDVTTTAKTPDKAIENTIEPSPKVIIEQDPDVALMTDPLSIVKNVFGGAEVL
jgi:glycerol-3-phosphate cytidylyltransferase-like family protein